jgi:hypothetical protein
MKAELTVGDIIYSITSSSLSFGQSVAANGIATSAVETGPIIVQLNSISNDEGVTDYNKKEIVQWMNDPKGRKDGNIKYYILDDEKVDRTIEFKQALCTSWAEGWGSNGMSLTVCITPQTTSVEGIEFKGPQNKS